MSDQNGADPSTLSIVRVFLASPGDLGDERRAARLAVNEINKTVARPFGFHIDLIGWEDTLSAAGRPQALINEELQSCQLFIGMLWGRWGTSTGEYSSGFEEEFELATTRNSDKGVPHIALFFKDVDQSKISDPGPELSRVLEFKRRVINEKKILFENFSEIETFGHKIRLCIANFVHKLRRAERAEFSETSSNDVIIRAEGTLATDSNTPPNSQYFVEATFLESASKILASGNNQFSAVEVARLRSIALGHGTAGNDEIDLGAHDANLMYEAQGRLDLSQNECSFLAFSGLGAFAEENAPLWLWLTGLLKQFPAVLFLISGSGPERRQIGALRALTFLRSSVDIPGNVSSEQLGERWFQSSSTDALKTAALEYIAQVPNPKLIEFAEQQFSVGSYTTRQTALEAVIRARSQKSVSEAARYAIGVSFDVLGFAATNAVLKGMEEVDDATLIKALDHRSGVLRGKAIELLAQRNTLTEVQATRFFGDTSLDTRLAALTAFENNFVELSDEEAKGALVIQSGDNQNGLSTLAGLGRDISGQIEFDARKHKRLLRRTYQDLCMLEQSKVFESSEFYLARSEAYFSRSGKQLRTDVDDRFLSYWAQHIDAIRKYLGKERDGDAVVKIIDQYQDWNRRNLVRRALDIIVARGEAVDLPRVRRALDEDVADPSIVDVAYFKRWGGWEDIDRVVKIALDYRSGFGKTMPRPENQTRYVANALLKLAKDRINELLRSEIPNHILASIIANMSTASFKALDNIIISDLMHREAASVRKATALQVVSSFGQRQVANYLSTYLSTDRQKYYNVVFWLDLCNLPPTLHAAKAAKRELERMS